MQLSRWNELVTQWIFRFGLLKAAYTREQLERMATQSCFGRCEIRFHGIGLELKLTRAGNHER
jgi:hypothetical protein